MFRPFNIRDWYWFVAGDTSKVYSSAKPGFISTQDNSYQGFVSSGGVATNIANLSELRDVILPDFPDGWTRSVDEMTTAIKAERDRRIQSGGYKLIVNGAQKWFHSDEISRIQQIQLDRYAAKRLADGGLPSDPIIVDGKQQPWKTMDGSFVIVTCQLADDIVNAAASNDSAVFGAAETHIARMKVATDPSAYDFSSGWPQTFQDTQP